MRLLNYLNFHLDNRKCAALEAGITATASTAAALASSASQGKSNHAGRSLARWQTNKNLELAHEQMAANRKMFEDSIAEQRLAEERANEWNKASAVAQRFRDAGINPYLAMTEGAAGAMSAQSGSSSMPTGSQGTSGSVAVSPSYAPVYDIGRGINDAVASFLQALETDSDIQRKSIQNENETAMTKANIEKLRKEGLLTDKQADEIQQRIDENNKTFEDRAKGLKKGNDLVDADIDKAKAEKRNMDADTALKEAQEEIARNADKRAADLNEAEIKQLNAAANELATRAAEMVKNGASQRELDKALKEQANQLRRKYSKDTEISASEAKIAANKAEVSGYETQKKRVEHMKTQSSRFMREFDSIANYIMDKFGRIIKPR